ncbi:hypothetical protein RDWZM_000830 [Blomia tropicalis]|uniref:Uncharacterized protein n=1 Tax=Blomia tropicalis TaxID=40697 RepID=A0A9Q0MAK0_BLOTA|nr:hypothetical protein RDWZM_000830 [Blomia tropicalis]
MDTMTTSDCAKRFYPGCFSENECKIICATSDDTGDGDGDSGGPVVFHDGSVVGMIMVKVYTNESMDEKEPWQERIFLRTLSNKKFIDFRELRHLQNLLYT